MIDNAIAHSSGIASSLASPRALDTILFGGLAVGALDALDAITFFGLRNGVSPTRIFQSVASGLLGRNSFNGGVKTALLGLMLHFLIAFILATIYYLASLNLPMLVRQPVVWGILYGVAVYFVMQYVVVPLSAATPGRFSFAAFLNGVIGHALLVGLPIALLAWRSAKVN
jgi:uncharacterized membrane protein YagU involved in acid resistance